MKLRAFVVSIVACVALCSVARAGEDGPREETDPTALFQGAVEALAAERPSEAIAKLEALADRGIVDAVVSFDRGLAYAARVRSGGELPGDLGRAAHGFEETRELTYDSSLSADAESALTMVRSEVARRRARSGDPVEIESGKSIGRSIVGLLPENAWAGIAGAMAAALSIAILVRRRMTLPRARVAATTTGAIAASLLLVSASLAWAARDERLYLREGVVITPNARLLDARHVAIDGVAPIPEGVRARILEENAGFSRIRIGERDGFLPSSSILPIAKR